MSLFESQSESQEFLWVAEALETGVIKHGQMLEVAQITATASGNGYILRCELSDGEDVYDFAYKKSKPGKTLTAMFDDPTVGDGWMVVVKAQDKKRCAVCDSRAVEGLTWMLGEENDNATLTPAKKRATGTKGGKQTQND